MRGTRCKWHPLVGWFLSLVGHSKQLKQLCTYLIGWGLYSYLSCLGIVHKRVIKFSLVWSCAKMSQPCIHHRWRYWSMSLLCWISDFLLISIHPPHLTCTSLNKAKYLKALTLQHSLIALFSHCSHWVLSDYSLLALLVPSVWVLSKCSLSGLYMLPECSLSKQARKQAGRQAGKQAGKKEDKQAVKQESRQSGKQASD